MSFESIDWNDENDEQYIGVVHCTVVGLLPDGTEVGMSASLLPQQDAPEAREQVEKSLRHLLVARYPSAERIEFEWQPTRLRF